MWWLLAIVFIVLMIFSLNFRLIVCNIGKVLYYAPIDLWNYFKHKEYNNAYTGFLDIYTGLFGRGKTLTSVHDLVQYYKRYHNKKVWCRERKKFVTQKVHVLSNIDLKTIPYVPLKNRRSFNNLLQTLQRYIRNRF